PMDVEQRIGRIHRYGQEHTAQVYNLVMSDTIEGKIFLLLEEKLLEIARAVGKVDDKGNIAEDLRGQILGQLSERLNYDRLYREALSDPELKRTQIELETALSNSKEAREVVFDLFQDLEGFRLDDYKPFSDVSESMDRLVRFLSLALVDRQKKVVKLDDQTFQIVSADGSSELRFTLDRELATTRDDVELMGLDHPRVQEELARCRAVAPESLGLAVKADTGGPALLSLWLVETSGANRDRRVTIQPIAVKPDGTRLPTIERQCERFFSMPTSESALSPN